MTLRFEIFRPISMRWLTFCTRVLRFSAAKDQRDRPWGLTDFRIIGPAGYHLRITNRGRMTASARTSRPAVQKVPGAA